MGLKERILKRLPALGAALFISLEALFLSYGSPYQDFLIGSVLLLTPPALLFLLKRRWFRKAAGSKVFWVLLLTSALVVGALKLLTLFDPLGFKTLADTYALVLPGAVFGPLFKSFLRKRKETFAVLLLINAFWIFFVFVNAFVPLGFLLANLLAAEIYSSGRDGLSELKALALGNLLFGSIIVAKALVYSPYPETFLKLVAAYPVAFVSNVFLLFGLRKLLDLLPFMFSDEKLEGLAVFSNPLVEEMLLKAPGTYYHSLLVSLLSESLAKKIGADPLIAKIGAMFHDIGKLVNPQYFVENQNGVNPHDNLKPEVSASIIRSHVSEGIKLARKFHLPEEIIAFIPEHQGTKLMAYFYHKALKENPNADIEKFRYKGPIPQSKESAIVMIADTVEAMVRSLKNPSAKDINAAVERAISGLLKEGQLKNSGLTEGDLEKIRKHLVELLLSYYHKRVKYPEPSGRYKMAS
jgi:putative nucleotidyltransferase with HDIG domain